LSTETPTTAVNPSEAINLTLANGSVVKGQNLQEAFDNLRSMYEHTQGWAREQKLKAEEASAEAERLRQEQAERQAVERPQPTGGYSPEEYYQLLNTDPIAAQNYLDQQRFGSSDPVGELNYLRNKVDGLDYVVNTKLGFMASRNFLDRHADFPQDTRSVEALQARAVGLIRADQYGSDIGDTLDMAYEQLIAEGVITPSRDDTVAFNPALTGSGGVSSGANIDAERLSDADLKQLLISHGMLSR